MVAGGNTIRNILTSIDSGIKENEEFDVEPYAIALTTRMINEDDSWNLPRKVKISFSNDLTDTTYTQATCLGFVAKIKDGKKGFTVYCGGGMGARPMVAGKLFDWVEDTQVYAITKAMKIMFDIHGNRRSKYSSRIKFLYRKLEDKAFKELFNEEYNKIKDDESLRLELPVISNSATKTTLEPVTINSESFETWKKRYVFKQKQDGLVSIKLPLQLGDLVYNDAQKLCAFLENFGENNIRCDRAQNIRLRNIPETHLGNAFVVINSMEKTLVQHAQFIGNMINCTGASTCKLGICLPRGLSDAIRDRLDNSNLNLDIIPEFRLNMSGCPNTCGMHHIAHLGFFGKIGRNQNREIYPAYNVLAGARVHVEKPTEYAKKSAKYQQSIFLILFMIF